MLIKNCRILIDGVEKVTDILTADGKIIEISENIPEGRLEVVDAKGKWVIPGVVSGCHLSSYRPDLRKDKCT